MTITAAETGDLQDQIRAYLIGFPTVAAGRWCGNADDHYGHDLCPGRTSDPREPLMRLYRSRDTINGLHGLVVLSALTPAFGADNRAREQWWTAFVHAADMWELLDGRATDCWTAQAVLDELGEDYGSDPYAAAQARLDDWDREIDRLVAAATGPSRVDGVR